MGSEWHFDPARLSARPTVITGRLTPAAFERLAELLATDEGELRFELSARLDAHGRRVASCIIDGFVFLTCQSTMEVFRHEVRLEERLVFAEREADLPAVHDEPDDEDFVVAAGPVDARQLVEDAVLLALPMVPRKPGRQPAPVRGGETGEGRASPFAALASLRKRK